jgi:hypothetical protein
LDLVPEILPGEAATKPHQPAGSRRSGDPDAGGRRQQYLSYKLIDSNQDWKAKWFYITNYHPGLPKPSGKQPKHRPWWNTELTMQEGIQLPELLARIKALRETGLRAEHVAFNFMKRRVQPLMARDTLGSSTPATTIRRGCLDTKSTTTTLSIGWCGSSRTCHSTRRAPSRSTPLRARRRR